MPLTPPPDYTKVVFAAAVGISLALTVWLLTKNTLPLAGDREHLFPHGGAYQDGVKRITYNRPQKLNSVEVRSANLLSQPWALVLLLSLLIWITGKLSLGVCRVCGQRH
nr:triple gene block protein 2 [Cole mild mosaic virus]